jgi:hypothetical protein
MLTPPRPGWITALRNSLRLFPEGAPVTAPDWCVAGQLDPSSMLSFLYPVSARPQPRGSIDNRPRERPVV